MWQGLGRAARFSIIVGAIVIVGLMALLAWWAYRPDYQVLFSDLAPRDAAAMTAELDKMKTPYQLAEGGNTILVPKDLVYKTRLKVMGKDVPLHGAVGFEVFNNADFGMTDFVQKVNYLRAIQGELTRTIISIDGIAAARVHLAIPEQGLFKKNVTKPKASVTLTMKSGAVLSPEQIAGIQRLVAASVPDIVSSDVTLLDQHGVALTRPSGAGAADSAGESALSQLDSKRSTEDYLAKKVTQVLDRTFGVGEAIASVDVALNLDQSKVTTEEVLPAKSGNADSNPTGVVVRERYTNRETADAAGATAKPSNGTTSSEFDYQVGRRTEQVSFASGTVKRMTIAVLVKQPLNETQIAQLKEVVTLAVGFNSQRGDAVVVHSMDKFTNPTTAGQPASSASQADLALRSSANMSAPAPAAKDKDHSKLWILLAVLVCVLLGLLIFTALRKRPSAQHAQLDDAARAQLLAKVRAWTESAQEPAGMVKK